jgi:hypothetical protein
MIEGKKIIIHVINIHDHLFINSHTHLFIYLRVNRAPIKSRGKVYIYIYIVEN